MIVKVGGKVIYERKPDEYAVYEITTTPGVRNNQAYVLGKVIASFYRKPGERRSWFKDGQVLTEASPYRCNFRIVMRPNDVAFYLLLPREKAGELLRKAEAIYDAGITIQEVKDALPKLDPAKTFCTELRYRKHEIFSLATDRDNNYPLPSLLTAVRTLEGDDVAVFDAMFEPTDALTWYKAAKQAHNLLDNGYVPNPSWGNKLLRILHGGIMTARYEALKLTRFTKAQKDRLEEVRKEESRYREAARLKAEMSNATKRKAGDDVLKAWLRIAVQSDDPTRRRDAAYTLSNAWKDLTGDNELERVDVPAKWTEQYLEAIETRKGYSIRFKPIRVSCDEAGKFMQLPGRSLIAEFPQIRNRSHKEVQLPDELSQEDIKTVRIGWVTERGSRKLAQVPLEGFGQISKKAVYDALCTTTFGQGKQGSGKSEGFGTVWAYDMVMAGFSAILIDTADGQVLRNFVNCLPEDYPDEKLHLLNLDNKAWPMPLGWDDVYGRTFATAGGDEELAALEISERLTARFVGFINGLSKTGEFTDRMAQYVISSMRAVTTKPGWSFLDLELALTSPAYREELLERPEVKAQPDVLRDLMQLQEKAAAGSVASIIDPILSRIKSLAATPFLANLFLQPPKLDESGKPIFDLRRIMDNPEGGYGHVVCVMASHDAWQEYQGVILGFFDDKINFNIYSRIDTDQANRKPCLKWWDEAHKVIEHIEDRAAETAVEFRKYRAKQLYTNHSIDQMGKAAQALLDGGAQITSYKTERLSELSRFAHALKPYDDAKALYDALPDKHRAVNKVRLPSGADCPAFIADMVPPPKEVKDRSYAWEISAMKYGRPWKEVRDGIQAKRSAYAALDTAWYQGKEEALVAAKQAKREARKAANE